MHQVRASHLLGLTGWTGGQSPRPLIASKLIAIVEDPESGLPADAIPTLKVLFATLLQLESEIGKLDSRPLRFWPRHRRPSTRRGTLRRG